MAGSGRPSRLRGLARAAALMAGLVFALPSPAREPVDVAGLRDAALALVNAARQEHGLAQIGRAHV